MAHGLPKVQGPALLHSVKTSSLSQTSWLTLGSMWPNTLFKNRMALTGDSTLRMSAILPRALMKMGPYQPDALLVRGPYQPDSESTRSSSRLVLRRSMRT